MKYVMITDWEGHWDKVKRTWYSNNMLREGMNVKLLKENTETIFIKIVDNERNVRKAWTGKILNIQQQRKRIYFSVDIAQGNSLAKR